MISNNCVTQAHVRAEKKSLRRSLSDRQLLQASKCICYTLSVMAEVTRAKSIALYMPTRDEISPVFLQKQLRQSKRWYLPCITTKNGLEFKEFLAHQPLKKNRFNILEPARTAKVIKPNNLDVLIVPIVAFDQQCQRIGMGGGFYDKTLSQLNKPMRRPLLIGLAHSVQQTPQINANRWDVPMDVIVTEKKIFTRRRMWR